MIVTMAPIHAENGLCWVQEACRATSPVTLTSQPKDIRRIVCARRIDEEQNLPLGQELTHGQFLVIDVLKAVLVPHEVHVTGRH